VRGGVAGVVKGGYDSMGVRDMCIPPHIVGGYDVMYFLEL